MTSRVCKMCDMETPIKNFGQYRAKSGNKVRRKTCNKCRSRQQSDRYKNDPKIQERMKDVARDHRLKKQYGITETDFQNMLSKQNNRCLICDNNFEKTANIDHCHDTGEVRGLLCWNCNIGLGYFKDSIENLSSAIEYLKKE